MSKSLGNFFTVRDVANQYGYEPIRYLMISCQYRSPINYSFDAIEQCKASLERLYTCRNNMDFALQNAVEEAGEKDAEIIAAIDSKKDKFIEAMEDDLNTGEALGAIFELVKEINLNVNDGVQSKALVEYAIKIFDELMNVLGLLYNRNAEKSLDDEIEALIQARNDARKAKNWAEADRIRDELKAQGIVLEDTPQGVKWHRA
jgi:cysteinyl-tRNA synthetase